MEVIAIIDRGRPRRSTNDVGYGVGAQVVAWQRGDYHTLLIRDKVTRHDMRERARNVDPEINPKLILFLLISHLSALFFLYTTLVFFFFAYTLCNPVLCYYVVWAPLCSFLLSFRPFLAYSLRPPRPPGNLTPPTT
jgi:hypothetical protein